jgi:hypothetical protein
MNLLRLVLLLSLLCLGYCWITNPLLARRHSKSELKSSRSSYHPLTRFDVAPITLFRVQNSVPVNIRSYERIVAAGRIPTSFDLHETDGLVLPASEQYYKGPNGMSLRPKCEKQRKLVTDLNDDPKVFMIPCGTQIPDKLILIHEHYDHYSLQAREPVTLEDLNTLLTSFLQSVRTFTKNEFLDLFNNEDPDDFDN